MRFRLFYSILAIAICLTFACMEPVFGGRIGPSNGPNIPPNIGGTGGITTLVTTLITSDTALNTGSSTSVTSSFPTGGGSAIVTKSGGSNQLWELVPSPEGDETAGSIIMNYPGTGSIKTTVNATQPNEGVNDYPFVFYGGDPYGDQIGGQPPQFPAQLSSMSSLKIDVTFAFGGTLPGDVDLLLDEWLIPTKTYNSGSSGSEECAITLYWSFADGQACSEDNNYNVTVTANGGSPSTWTFTEDNCGTGPGNSDFFYPPSSKQFTSGEMEFDILPILKECAASASLSNPNTWYLAGFELGTEDGDATNPDYTLTLTKYEIAQTL